MMLNKNSKQTISIIIIALTIFTLMNLTGSMGRSGFNNDFNQWYGENSTLVIIAGIILIVLMILWGFYESKEDKAIKMKRWGLI